jgi:hypothetical protein
VPMGMLPQGLYLDQVSDSRREVQAFSLTPASCDHSPRVPVNNLFNIQLTRVNFIAIPVLKRPEGHFVVRARSD